MKTVNTISSPHSGEYQIVFDGDRYRVRFARNGETVKEYKREYKTMRATLNSLNLNVFPEDEREMAEKSLNMAFLSDAFATRGLRNVAPFIPIADTHTIFYGIMTNGCGYAWVCYDLYYGEHDIHMGYEIMEDAIADAVKDARETLNQRNVNVDNVVRKIRAVKGRVK